MKTLITYLSFLIIAQVSYGQTTFTNGSDYYTLRRGPQLGTTTFRSYFKESIRLDSVVRDSEYYSVFRSNEKNISWKDLDSISYQLRVTDKKVFYTGSFYSDTNQVTATVKDVLFYDFSLKAGDTLFSIEPQSQNLQAYTCIIDSVRTITYQDGIPRVTQFARGYRKATPDRPSGHFRFIEGVGSTRGLMYQNIIGYPPDLSLISICINDSVSYLDSLVLQMNPEDYCDEEHIKKLMVSVRGPEHIQTKVYPNPTSSTLFISDAFIGTYTISNGVGETLLVGDASKPIDVSDLSPQLYFIQVFTKDAVATAKFIKVD